MNNFYLTEKMGKYLRENNILPEDHIVLKNWNDGDQGKLHNNPKCKGCGFNTFWNEKMCCVCGCYNG